MCLLVRWQTTHSCIPRLMQGQTLAVFDLDGTLTRRDTLLPFALGFLRRYPSRLWRIPKLVGGLAVRLGAGKGRDELKEWVVRCLFSGATGVKSRRRLTVSS